jgi:regulator of protease activity HflC (stomatin/prohibitin superfamily)
MLSLLRSVQLVPTKRARIVERLGNYHNTLRAGFHILLPFLDRVVYKLDLREETIDVPPQDCFTKDEVKVEVDGVMYLSVLDPVKASYGVTDYRMAATQLAQTTTRSVIGTLDLDRTFEERDLISSRVVHALAEVQEQWGLQVHRYEISNIAPPPTVKDAMEKQVTAERERRAIVARAEGEMQSHINRSEGAKMGLINQSEGEMQRQINVAEGQAAAILAIAEATAESITKIAQVVRAPGGDEAVRLQLTEKYLANVAKLASPDVNVLLPADLMNLENLLSGLGLSAPPRDGRTP